MIVSKDDDFTALSTMHGLPPQLIKLSLGNCGNSQVLNALVHHRSMIEAAFADPAVSTVELIADSVS